MCLYPLLILREALIASLQAEKGKQLGRFVNWDGGPGKIANIPRYNALSVYGDR